MFRSIRWRLVASYVLLTLLTATLMGVLAIILVRGYIERQEVVSLEANADAVASQAAPLLRPVVDPIELQELVRTFSFLGSVRVMVLDADRKVLADSGLPPEFDRLLWVRFPQEGLEAENEPYAAFILPFASESERTGVYVQEIVPREALEYFPPDTRFRLVRRVYGPWGSRVTFDGSLALPDAPRSARGAIVPIGDEAEPIGYVEVRQGPDFGAESLATTARAFLFAALGSLLLAGIVGLLMARRLTTPLAHLATAAETMGEGDLSIRAPEYGSDEIGSLARQFNQMAERLEHSFAALASERDALRRFIADASHELRTPITALGNFNELLQGRASDDPDAQSTFLAESQVQIARLEWITQNLLSLSRLDAGLTPLSLETHDVGALLQSAAAAFKPLAEEKGIALVVHAPEPSLEVHADRALLELALSNLLDNALKFTPSGGAVKIGAGQGEGAVRLWVRDNGSGIGPQDLPHVFERFYRGRQVEAEGSGLGLAMVQSVVQAHGGQVTVESEPGAGSQFTIELPLEE